MIISTNSQSFKGKYHIIYWSKNTIYIYEKYLWTTVGFWTQKKSVESTIKKFAVYNWLYSWPYQTLFMIRNGPFLTASKHKMKRCWSLLYLKITFTLNFSEGIFQHVNGTYHPILPLSLASRVTAWVRPASRSIRAVTRDGNLFEERQNTL